MKHSEEIKELAYEKYKDWELKIAICKNLKVSDKTLNSRIKKKEETGKIEDWRKNNWAKKRFSDEDLRKFYEENENATLEDWWKNFWVRWQSVGDRLKKIWYSHKKKKWNTRKEMKEIEEFSKKN